MCEICGEYIVRGKCEICWVQSWSHYSASNTINHAGDMCGPDTHGCTFVMTILCFSVFKEDCQCRDWRTGDLSHSPLRSLPSTQACQRLNWFSIVNLRSVSKENARYLTLLLQRPQSFFELFLAHSKWKRTTHLLTPGPKDWERLSYFFLSDFTF